MFIAEPGNDRVRKVTPTGTISTFAGTGTEGYSGDGGPATAAQLNGPVGLATDSLGNLYIAEQSNNRVRKVTPTGTITTFAGTGTAGYSGDGGPATSAKLSNPNGLVVDANGDLLIADTSNSRIRKVDSTGTITTVAGNGSSGATSDGVPATSTTLGWPSGVAVDGAGSFYIAEASGSRVRRVSPTGTITTVAGNGTHGQSGDGGPATSAQLGESHDVATDSAGNLYISDRDFHKVRKVTTSGTIGTVAGTGTAGYSGDGGPGTGAQLDTPGGVAIAGADLYIADYLNNRVRRVESATTITPTTTIPTTIPTTTSSTTTTTIPTTTTTSSTTTTTVPVAAFPSDDCNAGSTVVSGWTQNVYSSLRTLATGSSTSACVALEQGSTHLGGKVVVSTAGPVTPSTDDDQSACANPANAGDYHLIRDLSVLSRPFRIEAKVRPSAAAPTEVWVCVKADTVTKRLIVPTRVAGVPTFVADSTSPHSPAYASPAGPAGKASSTCQALGGQAGRLLNLQVGGTPAWLYTWQESPTRTHVCVRAGTGATDGGRLTIDRLGGVNVVLTDASADRSPCAQQVVDDVGPPPFWIYTSSGSSTPAWACLKVGSTFARVKVDTAGGQGIVTFTRDA